MLSVQEVHLPALEELKTAKEVWAYLANLHQVSNCCGHSCFQAHGCGGKAPDCNQAGAGHPLGDVRWSKQEPWQARWVSRPTEYEECKGQPNGGRYGWESESSGGVLPLPQEGALC
ncbi:hypothetical protein DUNSADRAFT_17202 [Dunaliella salina]|uniref:Uncharacterized protein n=1 Tax=Dunaliella salina TaxID=3046 RepID=A0ABQ7G282_DUNSA|nr:hypothetical protein DUNSADRAFT_17202 [Dunaliella salina]|eukprot:KAF5828702.1 hypothetical protein DUNSADRAFT_17202 [Dunaliella salina]